MIRRAFHKERARNDKKSLNIFQTEHTRNIDDLEKSLRLEGGEKGSMLREICTNKILI